MKNAQRKIKKIDFKTLVTAFVVATFILIGVIGISNSRNVTQKKEDVVIKEDTTKEKVEETKVENENKEVVEKTTPSETTKTVSGTTQKTSTPVTKPVENKTTENNSTPTITSKPTVTTKPSTPVAQTVEPTDNKISVTLTIKGLNGQTIASQNVKVEPGSTVYDVLKQVTNSKGIKISTSGAGATVYVRSINGLAERQHGPMSGWMYKVNGVIPNYGSGSYKVSANDNIVWYYDNVEY